MPAKVIFQHGLPGSGKSTASEKYVNEHPNEKIVIINRDSIRTSLFGEEYHKGNFPKKSEDQVTTVFNSLYRKALADGYTIIDDNTNLNPRFINSTVKMIESYGGTVKQQHFDVPIDECKRRNRIRGQQGGRLVPEFVIDNMAKNSYDETGHMKEFVISKNGVFVLPRSSEKRKQLADYNDQLAKKTPLKSKAVALVDIDGTLANNAHDAAWALGRPGVKKNFDYFYRNIRRAPVNETVRDAANLLYEQDGIAPIVLTGRDDSRLNELIDFVERSGLKAHRIICKRTGDGRPDGEFKKQVLEGLKEEGLIVATAFDDRESSIRTMEANGVLVSRVETPVFSFGTDDPAPRTAATTPRVNTIVGSGYCVRCGSKLKDPNKNIGDKCRTKM